MKITDYIDQILEKTEPESREELLKEVWVGKNYSLFQLREDLKYIRSLVITTWIGIFAIIGVAIIVQILLVLLT